MNRDLHNEAALEAATLAVSIMAMKKFQQPLVAYLLSGLEDNDKWVKMMAAEMLGTVGDAGVVGHLMPLLADKDVDLRTIAARSLAMIHTPNVVFTVKQVDHCENCMIRLVADEALERLKSGQDNARHL
jgi:HEAT repeat protein